MIVGMGSSVETGSRDSSQVAGKVLVVGFVANSSSVKAVPRARSMSGRERNVGHPQKQARSKLGREDFLRDRFACMVRIETAARLKLGREKKCKDICFVRTMAATAARSKLGRETLVHLVGVETGTESQRQLGRNWAERDALPRRRDLGLQSQQQLGRN
jgi:hypothetical protein